MRTCHSSSCSKNSSSSYSVSSTSLRNRLKTIFKKASELCILCEIEACVIHYGRDGELTTWPEDRNKVRDLALRYRRLNEALRRKKSVNLHGFLEKTKFKDLKNLNKTNLKKVNVLKYPLADHYSPDQVSQLIQSLEKKVPTFKERLRYVESKKHGETKQDHHSSTPSSLNHHHQDHQQDNQHQEQSLNPGQYPLSMYNNGDATLSQVPFSTSNFNQNFSTLLQEYGLRDDLMNQELCGYDQNMSMGNINSNNFQHPCVSNTERYSVVQESVNNYWLNQLTQNERCGSDQNLCTSEFTYSNVLHPYGNMVGNTSFSQDIADMSSKSLQESGLEDHLMKQGLCGYDQNVFMGDINSKNSQHSCVSNTERYSAVQESVNTYGMNQLTQNERCSSDQNLCTSDFTYTNVLDPYGNMVGNTSFSQDLADMSSTLLEESGIEDLLMKQGLYGYDQNIGMGDINSYNSQQSCISNTEHYSALQESVNIYGLNQLPNVLYGSAQNLCTSDLTYNNVLDPYGNMVGNPSFSQDLADMSSTLLQESGLEDHLMTQELCGYNQNICKSDINSNNTQNSCVSNTEH